MKNKIYALLAALAVMLGFGLSVGAGAASAATNGARVWATSQYDTQGCGIMEMQNTSSGSIYNSTDVLSSFFCANGSYGEAPTSNALNTSEPRRYLIPKGYCAVVQDVFWNTTALDRSQWFITSENPWGARVCAESADIYGRWTGYFPTAGGGLPSGYGYQARIYQWDNPYVAN